MPSLPTTILDRAINAAVQHALAHDFDFLRFGKNHDVVDPFNSDDVSNDHLGPVDYLFAHHEARHVASPTDIFDRLRWGGQFLAIAPDLKTVQDWARDFAQHPGYVVEQDTGLTHTPRAGLAWIHAKFFHRIIGKPTHYFIARKIALLQPGQTTERFVFDVQLARSTAQPSTPASATPTAARGLAPSTNATPNYIYHVRKRVPSHASVFHRLKQRAPQADEKLLESRTHKLVDHLFPVFLSREAAFLQLLQRDLPEPYRSRVPRVLGVAKDKRGLVRELHLNWLRVGGKRLSQLEFALQAAELLNALHKHARVIHLDLRLDNVVITDQGVGFVDFGSAVRMDEDLSKSPMLSAIFDEMMSTSQIQRLLGQMKKANRVTSKLLRDAHQTIDPQADLFYLAMQIAKPIGNPQLDPLIRYDSNHPDARAIKKITATVLRPDDPDNPDIRTAADLLDALNAIDTQHIKKRLSARKHANPHTKQKTSATPALHP